MSAVATDFGSTLAGTGAKRPCVRAGLVSAAGLLVGFLVAYSATELVRCMRPASTAFIGEIPLGAAQVRT